MLIVDVKKSRSQSISGVRRDYASGVWVKVRPIGRTKFREMQEAATKSEWENGRELKVVDQGMLDELMFDEIVEEWGGFVAPDKKTEIPATKENIVAVCDALPGFAMWLIAESNKIGAGRIEAEEKQAKN